MMGFIKWVLFRRTIKRKKVQKALGIIAFIICSALVDLWLLTSSGRSDIGHIIIGFFLGAVVVGGSAVIIYMGIVLSQDIWPDIKKWWNEE